LRSFDRRWIIGAAVTVVAFSLFGNDGFRRLVTFYGEKSRLQATIRRLRAEHFRLSQEVSLIRNDPAYSEYLVRKHLKYVKKGEVEYRVVPPPAKK
jgi:cell division protein FtsB